MWPSHACTHMLYMCMHVHVLTRRSQAISQLMGVEGDNAPTRQNIKSHLQKYRLLVKKRAAQAAEAAANGSGGGSSGGAIGKAGVERRVEKPLRAF